MKKSVHKYEPGDRVIVTNVDSDEYFYKIVEKGMTGTVVCYGRYLGEDVAHVAWDQLGGDHLDVYDRDIDPFDGPVPTSTSKRWSIDRLVIWFAQASFGTWFIALYLIFTIVDFALSWVSHESISKEMFAIYGVKNLVIACGFALSYQIQRSLDRPPVTIIKEVATEKKTGKKKTEEDLV